MSPPPEGLEGWAEAAAELSQVVEAPGVRGHDAGLAKLVKSLREHAGRHVVAAATQLAEAGWPLLQLPDHAQSPSLSEQIKRRHHRAPRLRAADWSAGNGRVSASDAAIIRESRPFLTALDEGGETTFDDQYMRMVAQFDTGDDRYTWLTASLFLGEGRVSGDHQIQYQIHRVD